MSPVRSRLRQRLPGEPMLWLRGGILAAALLIMALSVGARALAGTAQATPGLIGQPAPSFVLPVEQDGTPLATDRTLAALRGHPVLVVFFYTLCAHCLSQIQTIQTASRSRTAVGTQVIYIDSPAERASIVDAYVTRMSIQAPIALDANGTVAARYRVRFYPTVVLVDAKGIVRGVWMGETTAAVLEAAIAHA